MKRVIATGSQDFEQLRMNNRFYVDKTDFIREWWNGADAVTLITRPRRFGKTLNLSMLNCFFSSRYAGRSELFEGLKIWENEALRKEQGAWPVIFLSFADIKQNTFEETRSRLNQIIADLYNPYTDMLRDPRYTDADRDFFHKVSAEMTNDIGAAAIQKLCEWLYRYYGKKTMVFLDEYDTPLQEAFINGYWDELVSYTRALFNSTFKTNPYLERGIMTGITRVSKESIFSDLNNLVVVTTTSDRYATAFGFTEPEVLAALEEQGYQKDAMEKVRQWYDGFTFGTVSEIYNPWSIVRYLKEGVFSTYWANTSGNGLVGKLLREGNPKIKEQFETLLLGGTLTLEIDEQIVFDQLGKMKNAIWSLLLASGYLKVVRQNDTLREGDGYHDELTLALTNREVRIMFEKMVRGWFDEGGGLTDFTSAMLRGDVREMSHQLGEIIRTTMSYFDSGNHPSDREPENFYHGLVLGLLAENIRKYRILSNRESGFGRYDVLVEPLDAQMNAVILEFKVFDPEDGENTLAETAANALRQIEEKRYDTDLKARGIPENHILKYGIAFRGKECLIRKRQGDAD